MNTDDQDVGKCQSECLSAQNIRTITVLLPATKREESANYENTHETGLQEASCRYDVNIIFQTNDSSLFSPILV